MTSPREDSLKGSPEADETRTVARVSTFRAGELLCDRFRVVRFIARGGMGELYEAEDFALGERVALKTIRPEIASDERAHHRFLREIQLARKVTHPNICRIFDLFQHRPASPSYAESVATSFVTMELLQGETLSQRLRRDGPFTAPRAQPIVAQLASALSAAHDAGVVHRDFKSNNVMLLGDPHDDSSRAVVTDFGLAHELADAGVAPGATITTVGELLGTPDYMAPEQIEGGAVTPATDIYALGIVMYEMVTGQRPFAADTPVASVVRRLSGPPGKRPREIVPDLPVAWDRTVMRCLSRAPEDRFADASEIVTALESTEDVASGWTAGRIATLAAVVVAAVIGSWAWLGRSADSSIGTVSSTPNIARRAVAVLGFRNLTGREETAWLSTALAEMLTTELAAGEALRTIPGEKVDRMKIDLALSETESYAAETLARIRQSLGTDLVVSGSYVTVGSGDEAELRLDIRLQDSREGRTMSVVSESGRSTELLNLVSRAGSRLRDELRVDVVPAAIAYARASQPPSIEVARLYAEGLMHLRRFDPLGARPLFERAIQADSSFPLAHSGLAQTWSFLGYDNRARDAVARAFELSASLPRLDRLLVEGTYRELSSEWKEAIAIWRQLAMAFPDDVEHTLRLANAQIESGAAKDGLTTVETFRRRFPGVQDPRLELAESSAAETLSDFKRMLSSAVAAGTAAKAQSAQLLVAGAKLREGGAVLRMGDAAKSAGLFEEARRIYADVGDRAGVARALNNLAAASSDGPDTRRTVALYEEALGIARAVGEQDQIARLLSNLAIQERRAGNLQASLKMNQESLAIRSEIGDKTNAAISLNNIGNVLLDLGDFEGASRNYEQAVAMSREIGDRRSVARALHNAAESLKLQGEMVRARTTIEEALTIRRTIDDPASVATSLFGLGQIAAMQGDLATARRSMMEALEMDRRLDRRRPIAYSLYHLGELALVEGDLAEARRRHQEALDVRTQLGERGTAAESRVALAELTLEEGRASEAEALARDAAAIFAAQKAPDTEAAARATMALALLAQGRQELAQREADRARALVPNPQHVLTRLPVAIAAARVLGATDPSAAVRELESLVIEAARRGIPRHGFEARRAIAQIESRRSQAAGAALTAALRKDAQAQGFLLYAR